MGPVACIALSYTRLVVGERPPLGRAAACWLAAPRGGPPTTLSGRAAATATRQAVDAGLSAARVEHAITHMRGIRPHCRPHDRLADQRLEYRREEAKVRRNHPLAGVATLAPFR
jgi:hypothetical protein